MSTKSKFRGNPIEFLNNEWIFVESKLPVSESHLSCKCIHCDNIPTQDGHDSCLGTLNGVINACCGHGDIEDAYVQLLDGRVYYGEDAVDVQSRLKEGAYID